MQRGRREVEGMEEGERGSERRGGGEGRRGKYSVRREMEEDRGEEEGGGSGKRLEIITYQRSIPVAMEV